MNKLPLVSALALFLCACSGNDTPASSANKSQNSASNATNNVASVATSSKLSKFMDKSSVCEILGVEKVKSLFNTPTEIKMVNSGYESKYSSSYTCNYEWEREDKEKREADFINNTLKSVNGTSKKMTMRQRATEHSFSVTLEEYKRKAEYFMPKKLTEEQLEAQIAEAKKRAAKRLSDEQKKIAGDMANSMMEKMLRRNNENIKIDGIGEAAYWSDVGGGGLMFLTGNVSVMVSPFIADTKEEDIENAKRIAQAILQ